MKTLCPTVRLYCRLLLTAPMNGVCHSPSSNTIVVRAPDTDAVGVRPTFDASGTGCRIENDRDRVHRFLPPAPVFPSMRSEDEIREQYEFLKEELEDEEMRHEGVRQMFTYYRRALGWVLEEEHI